MVTEGMLARLEMALSTEEKSSHTRTMLQLDLYHASSKEPGLMYQQ